MNAAEALAIGEARAKMLLNQDTAYASAVWRVGALEMELREARKKLAFEEKRIARAALN